MYRRGLGRVGLAFAALFVLLVLLLPKSLPLISDQPQQQSPTDVQQQQCDGAAPDTAGSVWEKHCVKYQRVCLDSSVLILHEPQYQQVGEDAAAAAAAAEALACPRERSHSTRRNARRLAAGGHEAGGGAAPTVHDE